MPSAVADNMTWFDPALFKVLGEALVLFVVKNKIDAFDNIYSDFAVRMTRCSCWRTGVAGIARRERHLHDVDVCTSHAVLRTQRPHHLCPSPGVP